MYGLSNYGLSNKGHTKGSYRYYELANRSFFPPELNPDQRSGYQCHLDTPNVNYQDMRRDWLLVRYKPCKPFH